MDHCIYLYRNCPTDSDRFRFLTIMGIRWFFLFSSVQTSIYFNFTHLAAWSAANSLSHYTLDRAIPFWVGFPTVQWSVNGFERPVAKHFRRLVQRLRGPRRFDVRLCLPGKLLSHVRVILDPVSPELDMGRVHSRVGSGWVGSGRVGSICGLHKMLRCVIVKFTQFSEFC